MIWIVIIAVATLADRTANAGQAAPALVPFHSYIAVYQGQTKEILRSNFMNVALFYPAGLLWGSLLPEKWNTLARIILITTILALISTAIEFCQYHLCLGMAEIDDVIHNTLGALIGVTVGSITLKLKKPQQ